MKREGRGNASLAAMSREGLLGWLQRRLQGARRAPARLALLERIALAPRQSLALVEADGRRFLVATSTEGGPAFYALDQRERPNARPAARVSW
jgi:flagellar biogenesis protein FliO